MDLTSLHNWFLKERREFPWRKNISPYRVWISEVMLQQTRASVVIPYFERWMSLFPNIATLASARREDVIKCWEGLGYYSRVRNIHEGAVQIRDQFGGVFPSNFEDILSIKGIGSYTAGAILSFAFKKKAAAVDGNVKRVISRLLEIETELSKSQKEIEGHVLRLLPETDPYICMEALIELGATVCQKRAQCDLCPLQSQCKSHASNRTEELPVVTKRKSIETLHRFVLCLQWEDYFFVQKVDSGKVMADLWEFPYLTDSIQPNLASAKAHFESEFGLQLETLSPLVRQVHHFTRFKAHLYPYHCKIESKKSLSSGDWIKLSKIKDLPFSSGHRKILNDLT